jgi:flagella basal body P-ring formation protein FlgA
MIRLLFIALAATSSASAEVRAARAVPAGSVLDAQDIASGTDAEKQAFLGMEARRPLRPGQVLRRYDVTLPTAVRRQSAVIVLFRRGSLTLRTEGRALGAGQIGEMVNIALPARKKPVMGRITGPGQVEVGG